MRIGGLAFRHVDCKLLRMIHFFQDQDLMFAYIQTVGGERCDTYFFIINENCCSVFWFRCDFYQAESRAHASFDGDGFSLGDCHLA